MSLATLARSDSIGESNNFTLIRLVAAQSVIWGHSFALTMRQGKPDPVALFFGGHTYSGELAVEIFFVVSGFLVARSLFFSSSIISFAAGRILRIFPALIVCNFVIILAVYIRFNSGDSILSYISAEETKEFFLKNSFLYHLPSYDLPNAFSENRIASVNGSLRTLPAEVRMYLFLTLLAILRIFPRKQLSGVDRILVSILLAGLIGICATKFRDVPILSLHHKYYDLAMFFFAGVFYFVNRGIILLNWKICFASLVSLYIFRDSNELLPLIKFVALPYITLFLAYGAPYIAKANTFGDFSYGVYIYGWPVQQLFVSLFPTMTPWSNFIAAALTATALGAVSWHFIEEPMLRCKKYFTKVRIQTEGLMAAGAVIGQKFGKLSKRRN